MPSVAAWGLILGVLILFTVAMLPPVRAATVDVASGVRLRTDYGYLDTTRSQYYNSFSLYSNGTIYLNATGLEAAQPQHSLFFQQVSFGNGTMVIRVQSPQEPTVSALSPAFNSYNANTDLLELRFTANQNAPLAIIWGTPVLVQGLLTTAAFVIASIAGLIMLLALFNRMGIIGPGSRGQTPLNFMHGGDQAVRNRNFAGTVFIMLVLILIVSIMALWLGGL